MSEFEKKVIALLEEIAKNAKPINPLGVAGRIEELYQRDAAKKARRRLTAEEVRDAHNARKVETGCAVELGDMLPGCPESVVDDRFEIDQHGEIKLANAKAK